MLGELLSGMVVFQKKKISGLDLRIGSAGDLLGDALPMHRTGLEDFLAH